MNEEQDIDEFTERLSIINREEPHNYNFLTGYLIHASQYQNQNYNTRSQVYVKSILEKSQAFKGH